VRIPAVNLVQLQTAGGIFLAHGVNPCVFTERILR